VGRKGDQNTDGEDARLTELLMKHDIPKEEIRVRATHTTPTKKRRSIMLVLEKYGRG